MSRKRFTIELVLFISTILYFSCSSAGNNKKFEGFMEDVVEIHGRTSCGEGTASGAKGTQRFQIHMRERGSALHLMTKEDATAFLSKLKIHPQSKTIIRDTSTGKVVKVVGIKLSLTADKSHYFINAFPTQGQTLSAHDIAMDELMTYDINYAYDLGAYNSKYDPALGTLKTAFRYFRENQPWSFRAPYPDVVTTSSLKTKQLYSKKKDQQATEPLKLLEERLRQNKASIHKGEADLLQAIQKLAKQTRMTHQDVHWYTDGGTRRQDGISKLTANERHPVIIAFMSGPLVGTSSRSQRLASLNSIATQLIGKPKQDLRIPLLVIANPKPDAVDSKRWKEDIQDLCALSRKTKTRYDGDEAMWGNLVRLYSWQNIPQTTIEVMRDLFDQSKSHATIELQYELRGLKPGRYLVSFALSAKGYPVEENANPPYLPFEVEIP